MKNLKKQNNNQRLKSISGFTLIEALVAISILMIAIASPMTLAQKGLSGAILSKDQMIASFLAQDAIEAVKNIRDQIAVSQVSGDWLAGNGNQFLANCICDPTASNCNFDVKLPNSPVFCQINTTASTWDSTAITSGISTSPKLKISYTNPDINGIKYFLKYDYTGANCDNSNSLYACDSKFFRYVNIIKSSSNPDEAVVNVRVSWDSPQGVQKIDLKDFIYNYSENL